MKSGKLLYAFLVIGLLSLVGCSQGITHSPSEGQADGQQVEVAEDDSPSAGEGESTEGSVDDSKEAAGEITKEEWQRQTIAAVYYDKAVYEEAEEGYFYCVVLRENHDAYIRMQDECYGRWSEDGKIELTDWDSTMTFEKQGSDLYIKDLDVTYAFADEEIIPEQIKNYMETGQRINWLSEGIREVNINPQSLDNFIKNGDKYLIKDVEGEEFILDGDTVIWESVTCNDDNADAITWLERYLAHPAFGEEEDDSPYQFMGFAMGDIWSIEVNGNHIDTVKEIGYWD